MHEKRDRGMRLFHQLYDGLSKSNTAMSTTYRAEAIDLQHRYGNALRPFFEVWQENPAITDSFNVWLAKLEKGENVPGSTDVPREQIAVLTKVQYLDAKSRAEYETRFGAGNKILNQKLPANITTNQNNPQIFVISPNNKFGAAAVGAVGEIPKDNIAFIHLSLANYSIKY
jgi:hypothetical protein